MRGINSIFALKKIDKSFHCVYLNEYMHKNVVCILIHNYLQDIAGRWHQYVQELEKNLRLLQRIFDSVTYAIILKL